MIENKIKTFKLNFDGTFDEIAYENIKDVFTIINILAIYIQKIKTMYIWIGKNAAQSLKNHIPQIRVLLKDEFPDFRIIRNITFDMRAEPLEFFNNLNMKKEELYEIFNYQEKTVLPILEKIDALKEKSEKLIRSEHYKTAINLLKEIIELAKKIQDDALVIEQKRLLSELTEKYENKEIVSKIEEETTKVEEVYDELMNSSKILEAHNLVEKFINKYDTIYDLSLIPSAKKLIFKEKRKWNSEQEKLRFDIIKLENEIKSSLEQLEFSKATEIFEHGLLLLANLIDEKIRIRWDGLKKNIQDTKEKVAFIENFDLCSKDFAKLKQNHEYKELKSKIKELIRQLEKIDLPEYRIKLNLLKNEIEFSEQSYNTINNEINELEKIIKNYMKNNNLDDIVKDCCNIISLANSIGKIELVEDYNKILEVTKSKIKEKEAFEAKQKELEVELSTLEEQFKISLKAMNFKEMNNILEKVSNFLPEIVDDNLKNRWYNNRASCNAAKQLLKTIELLSKNAIDSLDKGFFSDSLEIFEKIIIQLQEYRTQ